MDLLFHGGTILTMDPRRPTVEAILVRGRRIHAVGSLRSVEASSTQSVERINLGKTCMIPGFNDDHVHTLFFGVIRSQPRLYGLNQDQIIDMLRGHAASGEHRVLSAGGWDYEWVPDPSRDALDAAFPDVPVVLSQFGGHSLWVNSRGLELLGITEKSPDPPIGELMRDASGRLTGILRELPAEKSLGVIFRDALRSVPRQMDFIREAIKAFNRTGITSVQDNTWFGSSVRAFRRLHTSDELDVRVQCWEGGPIPVTRWATALQRYNPDWFARGPVKYFLDGTYSSRTAYLSEDYAADPGRGKGLSREAIHRFLRREAWLGRQVACHSIGDQATHEYLEAQSWLLQERPGIRQRRNRIEHAQLVMPDDIPRIAGLGMVVSAQPHAMYSLQKDVRILGEARALRSYPYRSLLDAGVPLAFGSDIPGEASYAPMTGIHNAVNHPGEEGITVEEALSCYTRGSAYAEFREDEKGMIAPGMLADLCVLSDDPRGVPQSTLKDVTVQLTIVDGRIVFDLDEELSSAQ